MGGRVVVTSAFLLIAIADVVHGQSQASGTSQPLILTGSAPTNGSAPAKRDMKAVHVPAIVIDPKSSGQAFEGWGTSLYWWANVVGKWPNSNTTRELLDLFFSREKGLGLNIVRYNIGGGETPEPTTLRPSRAIPGFAPAPGKWDPDADAPQRRILLAAIERGANIVEAASNSPPWWMTISGSVTGARGGGNNLRPDMEEAFADYLTDVVKLYRDKYGVRFRTLDPMNEPFSDWWKPGITQEGCAFDLQAQQRILTKTGALLLEKGLGDTSLSAPDANSIDETCEALRRYAPDVLRMISQVNTHSYHGNERRLLSRLAAAAGKRLWMSEYGVSIGRHDHQSMATGLVLARTIMSDLNQMRAVAWVYWQVAEPEPRVNNWGLVHIQSNGPEGHWITRAYYVFAQFTRVVRPGCTILKTADADTLAAWDPGTRNLSIVALNETDEPRQVLYDLKSLGPAQATARCWRTSGDENLSVLRPVKLANGFLSLKLKPRSVTSAVCEANRPTR